MRTPRCRLPKDFSLEDRLAGCAQAVEFDPASWRGRWREWAPVSGAPGATEPASDSDGVGVVGPARYERVVLDLGCGKGEYTVACAQQHPDTLFVGLDVEGVCVMRGAERALAEGTRNAVFIWADDPDLATLFAPGELDGILLNFPTPFPKKKKAPLRLTYLDRLMAYRAILAPGAGVRLRTDSLPFRTSRSRSSSLRGTSCDGAPTMFARSFPTSRRAPTRRKRPRSVPWCAGSKPCRVPRPTASSRRRRSAFRATCPKTWRI